MVNTALFIVANFFAFQTDVSVQVPPDMPICKMNIYLPKDYGFNNNPRNMGSAAALVGFLPALAANALNKSSREAKIPPFQKAVAPEVIGKAVADAFSNKMNGRKFEITFQGGDQDVSAISKKFRDDRIEFDNGNSCRVDFLIQSVAIVNRAKQTYKGFVNVNTMEVFGQHRVSTDEYKSKDFVNNFYREVGDLKNWPPKSDDQVESLKLPIERHIRDGMQLMVSKAKIR